MAITLAQRQSRKTGRTFGLYRAEVFAALFNAVLLFGVAGWILYEAAQRITNPPEVPGIPVMLVALLGLAMNLIAFLLLRSGAKESLNVRGAYLEVMADMLGSIGVLVSGLVTVVFGWRYADPVIAVAIGLFVLPRGFTLGRHAVRILLQPAPSGIDVAAAIPIDVEHAAGFLEQHAVVVMGGTVPGHTTDAVAIRLAVAVGAGSCIIATNVSHVHSADPATDPDAVARERMTLAELQEIVGPPEHVAAGPTAVIDPIGVQVAIDAGLPLRVLDGRRLQQLAACISGETFEGTAVEVG